MRPFLTKPSLRDWVTAAALLLAAAALIAAPQQAMEGAQEGLSLCAGVILPALFPFLMLASLAVELGLAAKLGRLFGPVMRPLFRVNGAGACAVVLGFVGGYPVGARTALDLYRKGQLSRTETMRLLAFCNNSGPAFILGVAGAGVFADRRVGLLLYAVHLLASLCVGFLFRFYGRREEGSHSPSAPSVGAVRFSAALTGSAASAVQSVLGICSFVVFFSVIAALLRHFGVAAALSSALAALFGPLGLTEEWAARLLTGLLELSSGVASLSGSGELAGRVSMAAFLLGWAGVSVHCQVLSFLGESGLGMTTYLTGKALHGLLSAGLTGLLLRLFPLSRPVSSYLSDAVETLGMLDFSTALSRFAPIAAVTALLFLLLGTGMAQKRGGKRRKNVV